MSRDNLLVRAVLPSNLLGINCAAAAAPTGNVYLIGLMGCGKSTIGRHLAERLRWQFMDTDSAVEETTGVTINHIFELEGEAGFRQREAKVFAEVARKRGVVVATGGGIILRADNRQALQTTGAVIYLRAAVEFLYARLRDSRTRPLLNTPDPREMLAAIWTEREPLYRAAADLIVDIVDSASLPTVNKIHQFLSDACAP